MSNEESPILEDLESEIKNEKGLRQVVDILGFLRSINKDYHGDHIIVREIIQNADDCSSERIIFDFCDNYLQVANNGNPFTDTDWNRISLINQWGKQREERKIGQFGIGFNSVYQLTRTPMIYSKRFMPLFTIQDDEDNQKRVKDQFFEAANGELFKEYKKYNFFFFPFYENITDDVRDFAKIFNEQDRLELFKKIKTNWIHYIIFLHNVLEIEFRNNSKKVFTIKRSKPKIINYDVFHSINESIFELVSTDKRNRGRKSTKTRILFLNKIVDPQSIGLTKKIEKRDKLFSIGIDFNDLATRKLLFCYLPTGHVSALHFYINGSFFPSSNRSDLDWEEDWNKFLLSQVPEILKYFFNVLKTKLKPENFLNLYPDRAYFKDFYSDRVKQESPEHSIWEEVITGIHNVFLTSESVYCQKAKGDFCWVKPTNNNLFIFDKIHKKLFNENDFHPFFIIESNSSDQQKVLSLYLGVKKFNKNNVIKYFEILTKDNSRNFTNLILNKKHILQDFYLYFQDSLNDAECKNLRKVNLFLIEFFDEKSIKLDHLDADGYNNVFLSPGLKGVPNFFYEDIRFNFQEGGNIEDSDFVKENIQAYCWMYPGIMNGLGESKKSKIITFFERCDIPVFEIKFFIDYLESQEKLEFLKDESKYEIIMDYLIGQLNKRSGLEEEKEIRERLKKIPIHRDVEGNFLGLDDKCFVINHDNIKLNEFGKKSLHISFIDDSACSNSPLLYQEFLRVPYFSIDNLHKLLMEDKLGELLINPVEDIVSLFDIIKNGFNTEQKGRLVNLKCLPARDGLLRNKNEVYLSNSQIRSAFLDDVLLLDELEADNYELCINLFGVEVISREAAFHHLFRQIKNLQLIDDFSIHLDILNEMVDLIDDVNAMDSSIKNELEDFELFNDSGDLQFAQELSIPHVILSELFGTTYASIHPDYKLGKKEKPSRNVRSHPLFDFFINYLKVSYDNIEGWLENEEKIAVIRDKIKFYRLGDDLNQFLKDQVILPSAFPDFLPKDLLVENFSILDEKRFSLFFPSFLSKKDNLKTKLQLRERFSLEELELYLDVILNQYLPNQEKKNLTNLLFYKILDHLRVYLRIINNNYEMIEKLIKITLLFKIKFPVEALNTKNQHELISASRGYYFDLNDDIKQLVPADRIISESEDFLKFKKTFFYSNLDYSELFYQIFEIRRELELNDFFDMYPSLKLEEGQFQEFFSVFDDYLSILSDSDLDNVDEAVWGKKIFPVKKSDRIDLISRNELRTPSDDLTAIDECDDEELASKIKLILSSRFSIAPDYITNNTTITQLFSIIPFKKFDLLQCIRITNLPKIVIENIMAIHELFKKVFDDDIELFYQHFKTNSLVSIHPINRKEPEFYSVDDLPESTFLTNDLRVIDLLKRADEGDSEIFVFQGQDNGQYFDFLQGMLEENVDTLFILNFNENVTISLQEKGGLVGESYRNETQEQQYRYFIENLIQILILHLYKAKYSEYRNIFEEIASWITQSTCLGEIKCLNYESLQIKVACKTYCYEDKTILITSDRDPYVKTQKTEDEKLIVEIHVPCKAIKSVIQEELVRSLINENIIKKTKKADAKNVLIKIINALLVDGYQIELKKLEMDELEEYFLNKKEIQLGDLIEEITNKVKEILIKKIPLQEEDEQITFYKDTIENLKIESVHNKKGYSFYFEDYLTISIPDNIASGKEYVGKRFEQLIDTILEKFYTWVEKEHNKLHRRKKLDQKNEELKKFFELFMIENPEEKKVQIQPIAELIDETSGLEALTPEDHVAETSGLEALATEDHVDETLGLEALAPEDRVAETSDLEALAPEDFFTEPSAAKSSAAKPSAAKSSAAKPHLAIPSTAKSSAAKPHHAIPSTAEPSFAKQSYNKPPVDNTPAGSKKRKNRKQKRHKTRTHSITNDIQNDIENGIEWKPECKPGEFESELEYHFQEYIPTDSIVSIKLDESEGIDEEEIEEADTDNDKNDETHRKKSVFDQKNKREIGKWGEARVYHTLEKNLMIKYPNGTKLDTIKGFKIEDEGKTLVEVIWYNKVAEKGVGSDIKVVENEIETFIDVKSTTTENKQWFDVTRRQWEQAKIAGSRYYIYRIFNAGTHFARIEIINDLYQKWKNEEIGVCPVKIKI